MFTFVGAVALAGPVAAQEAPANDSFAAATVIPVDALPYTTTQDSLAATSNTGGIADPTPVCSDGAADYTVWYRMTTTAGMTISATTALGDFFPPSVNVYRQQGNKLYPAGCGSESAVQLSADTTYYFMLASFTGRPEFSFTVASVTPPANDSFAAATVVPADGLPYTATQDSLTATRDTDGITDPAPVCSDGASGFTVWYRLTTSAGLTVTATTEGADFFPPSVNVYRLHGNKLYPAGCGSEGAVQLSAETTYYFMLASFTPRPEFSFTVASVTPPANDSFASPTVIPADGLPYTATQDSLTATRDTDGIIDPAPVCSDGASGFTVWYRLTTSAGLTVTATTEGADFFPPSVNVYRLHGSKLDSAGCGSDGPMQLLSDTTYYFMLASFTPRPEFSFSVAAVTG